MNTTRAIAALSTLTAVLLSGAAAAGVITSSTGAVKINGETVSVEEGAPVQFPAGATIETLDARVTFRSDAGDVVTLEPGTTARSEGTAEGVEYLFIASGAAQGELSDKTSLGGTAGWISPPAGQRASVFLDVQDKRAGSEGTVRALSGDVFVRFHDYRVFVPQQHTVTLAVNPAQPDYLAFRTGQQNPGDVDVTKVFGGGEVSVSVPKASIGRLMPVPGNKTRIENDITSLKTGKMGIETRFGGKPQAAELGPGTYALIDNATGDIEIAFTAVEFVILEQAVSLTSEFATLAQSNFSDVGVNARGRR